MAEEEEEKDRLLTQHKEVVAPLNRQVVKMVAEEELKEAAVVDPAVISRAHSLTQAPPT